MRSLSGASVTQGKLNQDMALRYHITPEVVPVSPARINPELLWTNEIAHNLYEVRLTFRWPVLPTADYRLVASPNRKVFRTVVSGLLDTNTGLLNSLQFEKP